MKDDTISRQAALDALGERPIIWSDNDEYTLGERNQYDMDRLAIETVPSTQLAQDLPKGCTDTISRKGVLSLLDAVPSEEFATKAMLISVVNALPSAQPVNIAKLQPNCNQVASDCISRVAAISICDNAIDLWNGQLGTGALVAVRDAIMALPPAQPGWIPVTERLPEDEEEVIVSIHDDSGDYSCDYTSSGWYAAAGEFWVVDNEANMRVTAWMPLPTPWEGERHD